MSKKKLVLLTGGKGFIGGHLKKALKSSGDFIVFSYEDDVLKGLPDADWDIIYHLAANTNTIYPDDIEMYYNNINTSLEALRMALKRNCRLIYASSGAVYGNGKGPLNAYGHSKLIFDQIAAHYYDRIPIVGLRFFNVYGPGEEKKGKMASMITQWRLQMQCGLRPRIFKTQAKRDFVYIKDVIRSLLMAQNLESGCYDVGTGRPVSFRKVLRLLQKEMGINLEPVYIENPHPEKYQFYTKADISWGFKPKYYIEDGIRDYLKSL